MIEWQSFTYKNGGQELSGKMDEGKMLAPRRTKSGNEEP